MSSSVCNAPKTILKALSLPLDGTGTTFELIPEDTEFVQTAHLRTISSKNGESGGVERNFYVKLLSTPAGLDEDEPPEAEMFRGEFISLNAIASAVPGLCPRAIAWGELKDDNDQEDASSWKEFNWYLLTEFLQLNTMPRRAVASPKSLAARLGKLHSTVAPPPPTREEIEQSAKMGLSLNAPEGDGRDGLPQFGFPVPTFVGSVRQPNEFRRSWADFYASQRLIAVLLESEARNGPHEKLRELVERVVNEVVPRLLGDGHLGFTRGGSGAPVRPVLVHGDLWWGNTGVGKVCHGPRWRNTQEESEDDEVGGVIYDPSTCYGHSEFELGIMKFFGGFTGEFYDEYRKIVPKTKPVDEFEDRVTLYELLVKS